MSQFVSYDRQDVIKALMVRSLHISWYKTLINKQK